MRNYISIGETINYQHTNMWGDLSWNQFDYMCSGAIVKDGQYTFRFTQIGPGSVSDKYADIFIEQKDLVVGMKTVSGMIVSRGEIV